MTAYVVFSAMALVSAGIAFLLIVAAANTPIPNMKGIGFFVIVSLVGVAGIIGTFIAGFF